MYLLLVTLLLPVYDDNKIDSENKASTVRPPASDYFISMKTRLTKMESKSEETLNADDIKKIEARKDEEVSVKGKVFEVFIPSSGSIAILNFGKDSKKCFKAVVFKSDFEKFDGGAKGIKKKYTGKTVTVEGKVSIYKDAPQIAVKTPSQLKVN
jgi:DNA/RNA endonuclease YhcR with UshA esterase domain